MKDVQKNFIIEEINQLQKRQSRHFENQLEPKYILYFSQRPNPEEFPKAKRIWLGHPSIARFVVRLLIWWNRN